MALNGEVTTWYMTPEQLAEYVAKHPIIPKGKPKGTGYSDIHDTRGYRKKQEERRKLGNENRWPDYK